MDRLAFEAERNGAARVANQGGVIAERQIALLAQRVVFDPERGAVVLDDQFDRCHTAAALRGDVVVFLYGDKASTEANKALAGDLHVAFHPTAQGKPPAEALDHMPEVVREMHTASGLLGELASGITLAEAQEQVLAYVRGHVREPRKVPLCGNSIATDRTFIARDMPELDAFLHYRMVDVSSIKELARRWYPRGRIRIHRR